MNRSLTLLFAVSLLGGCVLYGGKGLEVEPAGPLYAGESVRLTVRGPCSRVTVSLGGKDAGTYRANTPIDVIVPAGVREGTHRLRIEAVDSDFALSAEREVRVIPGSPEFLAVSPPVGTSTNIAPFRIEVTFSHAILPERLSWIELSAQQGSLPPLALSPDQRSISVDLPMALWELGGTVRLRVSRSVFGPERDDPAWVFTWTVPRLALAVESPVAPIVTNGPVTVRLAAQPSSTATQASLRLLAKHRQTLAESEVAAAEYTATGSTVELIWDPSAMAQGVYDLSVVAAPPVALTVPALPPVTIDRGAPNLVSCTLEAPGTGGAFVNGCIMVRADEPFALPAPPRLHLGGLERTAIIERFGYWEETIARVCPEPMDPIDPFAMSEVEELTELDLEDSARNLATVQCSVSLPFWVAPWGTAPIAGVSATPGGLGLHISGCGWDQAHGYLVQAGGQLASVDAVAPDPWQISVPVNATAGSIATEAHLGTWIERVGVGPGQVYPKHRDPGQERVLNLDTDQDAAGVRRANSYRARNGDYWGGDAISWTEMRADGRRGLAWYTWDTYWQPGPDPGPGASVHEQAMATNFPGLTEEEDSVWRPVFAWTEAVSGGVRRLRAAWRNDSVWDWEALDSIDNVDPAVDAHEPTVWDWSGVGAVAWREGGTVWARLSVETTFGPAVALNVDPSRQARRPVFERGLNRPRVYFLEETDVGDAIYVKEWDGVSWRLLPFPVNTGSPGQVVDYVVEGGVIAWLDPAGQLRVRRSDCF